MESFKLFRFIRKSRIKIQLLISIELLDLFEYKSLKNGPHVESEHREGLQKIQWVQRKIMRNIFWRQVHIGAGATLN